MYPYWILFGVFAIGAILHSRLPAVIYPTGRGFLFACVGIALMIGLRLEVGGDWYAYLEMLRVLGSGTLIHSFALGDIGYGFLNWLAGKADLGIWAVNLACGSIYVWGLVRLSAQQTNPWLAVLVSIPYMTIVVAMGYTRQGAALGFLMAGLASFNSRSVGKFFRDVALAVTFHRSAIVFLPFGLLSASRNRLVIAVLSLVMTLALYFAFVAQSIDQLVRNYVDAAYSSQGAAIRVATSVPPALFFLFYRRRFGFGDAQTRLYTNMSIAVFLAVVALATIDASTAIDRLALYLLPLQIVVLARTPQLFARTPSTSIAVTSLIVLYLAAMQYVWLNYAANAQSWIPYRMYGLG